MEIPIISPAWLSEAGKTKGRYRALNLGIKIGQHLMVFFRWDSAHRRQITESESILSPSPCPGDEQPQACPKFLTPRTSQTEPLACANSTSQSSEAAAENTGKSTMASNPRQGWLFLSSTALQVYHMGELIP